MSGILFGIFPVLVASASALPSAGHVVPVANPYLFANAVCPPLGIQRCVSPDTSTPPMKPPGRLIDVGGWKLHLNCVGEGKANQPTVVLEAGAGDFSVDWSLVQPEVGTFARACSYDRAGSGWSDMGPRPRTMHQIAYELHTLLGTAGERPPYLLVGHSYGGVLVRVYQIMYPTEVAGLVLVDPEYDNPVRVVPGRKTRASELATGQPIPEVKTSGPLHESDIPPSIVGLIKSQLRDFLPHVNDPPRNKLPEFAKRMRTWAIGQIKMAASNDNPFDADELTALFRQRTASEHALGTLPLVVLSRGQPEDSPDEEAEHRQDMTALASMSTTGTLIVAEHSGHHIPLDQPELVVAAIRALLATAH